MMTLLMLAGLSLQEKPDLEKTRLYVYDSTKGMTLKVLKDGSVELTVTEEDPDTGKKGSKTYSAPSVDEFRRKHPDASRKYEVDRYTGSRRAVVPDDFDQLFRDFRRGLPEMPPIPRLDPFDGDLEKWMEEQRRYMDELRKRFGRRADPPPAPLPAPPPAVPPAPAPLVPEFGLKVEPVEDTLRDQLSLKEGEGVMVGEVKTGSTADKSGLKKHDIILKLDGKAVGDTWSFRKDVLKALEQPEFEVEILRAGKRETLKAKPGSK